VIYHRRLRQADLADDLRHMWSVARVSSQATGGKLGQSSARGGERLGMTALLYVRACDPL
jgi:hypothetical protein